MSSEGLRDGQGIVWHRAIGSDALDDGEVTVCPVGLKSVALTNLRGEFGAIDNRCPHQGGPLGQGTVENGKIRCPWHGWEFDIVTGKGLYDAKSRVATYVVEVDEKGDVVVLV